MSPLNYFNPSSDSFLECFGILVVLVDDHFLQIVFLPLILLGLFVAFDIVDCSIWEMSYGLKEQFCSNFNLA